MSRTDNTTPFWVRAEWYEPDHHCRQHRARRWPGNRIGDCDLPAEPVRHPHRFSLWRHPELTTRCTWEPVWTYDERYPHGPATGARKTDRRVYWNGPQRALLRAQLGQARQEWNGSGDTDVEPCVEPHRHRAEWLCT